MFHDQEFMERMKKTPTHTVIAVKAGHWLQLAQAEIVTKEIVSFIYSKHKD
jgi:hypothetical protein